MFVLVFRRFPIRKCKNKGDFANQNEPVVMLGSTTGSPQVEPQVLFDKVVFGGRIGVRT